MNGLGDAHVVLFYCRAVGQRERCRYRSGLGTNGRVSGFMTGKDVIRQVD